MWSVVVCVLCGLGRTEQMMGRTDDCFLCLTCIFGGFLLPSRHVACFISFKIAFSASLFSHTPGSCFPAFRRHHRSTARASLDRCALCTIISV